MSIKRRELIEKVGSAGIVAVVRMDEPEKVKDTCMSILEGGVECLEITMTVPGAIDQIRQIHDDFGDRLVLGVGSVIDSETLKRAVDAGARYVVSPILKAELIATSHNLDVPIMPGAFTPTEIQEAHELGADVIKVFPAAFFGPKYIKAVKAPLPHLRLMPTGGVSSENAGDWIRAGSFALGVGSALVNPEAIADSRFEDIKKYAASLVEAVKRARQEMKKD